MLMANSLRKMNLDEVVNSTAAEFKRTLMGNKSTLEFDQVCLAVVAPAFRVGSSRLRLQSCTFVCVGLCACVCVCLCVCVWNDSQWRNAEEWLEQHPEFVPERLLVCICIDVLVFTTVSVTFGMLPL